MPEIDKFTFSFFFDIVTFCVHSEVDDEDWHKQNTVIVFLKKKQSQLHPFDLYKPDLVKIQWNPHKLSLKIISFLDPATTRIWVIFLIPIFSAQFLSHERPFFPSFLLLPPWGILTSCSVTALFTSRDWRFSRAVERYLESGNRNYCREDAGSLLELTNGSSSRMKRVKLCGETKQHRVALKVGNVCKGHVDRVWSHSQWGPAFKVRKPGLKASSTLSDFGYVMELP